MLKHNLSPTCRVLITGVHGFSGRHLAARLAETSTDRLIGLPCDLTDPEAVGQAVERADPDVVFHMAGIFGSDSPEEIQRVNVGGFVHLRDALRRQAGRRGRPIRLLVVGSAAEIGIAGATRLPVAENACCQPQTAYGRSKWEATRLALAEPPDGPLAIVVARPFNLVGPGLSPRLGLGNFARQIADVALGRADAIRCGPLDARRDYLDVRDAVEAYRLLVERGRPGQLYNVCAGRSYEIGDLLQQMLALAGVRAEILSRPADRAGNLADIYGDPRKVAAECGWAAKIDIQRSLGDMVAWAIADRPPSGTPDGWGVESK
jgi:GDP-4-dehydro-6-deoxy-D-mannose reductase